MNRLPGLSIAIITERSFSWQAHCLTCGDDTTCPKSMVDGGEKKCFAETSCCYATGLCSTGSGIVASRCSKTNCIYNPFG